MLYCICENENLRVIVEPLNGRNFWDIKKVLLVIGIYIDDFMSYQWNLDLLQVVPQWILLYSPNSVTLEHSLSEQILKLRGQFIIRFSPTKSIALHNYRGASVKPSACMFIALYRFKIYNLCYWQYLVELVLPFHEVTQYTGREQFGIYAVTLSFNNLLLPPGTELESRLTWKCGFSQWLISIVGFN